MNGTRFRATARGFSLIEVAVALFIVTLVMGGIIAMVNAMVANRQIESTRTKQEAIKTALISFIARNHRLPCPAIPTLADNAVDADTNVREGYEARTQGTCEKTAGSADIALRVVTGVVPWASLGLPQEVALDAYANRLTYQVMKSATMLNAQTVSGMVGRISIHNGSPVVLGKPPAVPTGNQINDCTPTGTSINPCAAVAVIVSHGRDSYGAYTQSGGRYQFDTTITGNDARENANDDEKFVNKDYSESSSNPFDDMVLALTANDLLSSLGLNFTTGINNAIESAKNTVILTILSNKKISGADTCASGACSRAPGCSWSQPCAVTVTTVSYTILESIVLPNDPWGQPLQYERAPKMTAVGAGTDPAEPVFTITSLGPDSVLGGDDDISQTVTASEFIGRISRTGL